MRLLLFLFLMLAAPVLALWAAGYAFAACLHAGFDVAFKVWTGKR